MAGCFGIRLLHWGPILAFTIIGVITTFTVMCHLQWWPVTTIGGALDLAVFLLWNILTIYNLISAAFSGPGYVPYDWKPKLLSDSKYLQYCDFCDGYKAPRSHHCRKCQRCVMKMDHHCPWINNCVGHFNHASFTCFLFFAPCGCIHALFILVPSMYRAINRSDYILSGRTDVPLVALPTSTFLGSMFGISLSVGVTLALFVLLYLQTYYMRYGSGVEPLVFMSIKSFIGSMFSCGLAIGVIVAVGGLFVCQMKSILQNQTGIEGWICDKADYREREEEEPEFVYPYHLGRWQNIRQVFHFRPRPELNGIFWPVKEGCNQYTLTVEQIKQKQEKKDRSVVYGIRESFSGSLCPCTKGCCVCCCPPCTDEPRIALAVGDKVVVSRWKKHWLYGEKLLPGVRLKGHKRIRGWFPRRCAVEILEEEHDGMRSSLSEQNSGGNNLDKKTA